VSCHEFVDFLDAYLDGELPRDVAARFAEHLSLCPSCVAYANTYRTTRELARRTLLEQSPAQRAPEELIAAILAARDGGRPS
jgi:anti-sigma factor (TIGR02949 family)